MDHPIKDPLARAERHVWEAEARIARQEILVAELTSEGRDTVLARNLLGIMQEALVAMRDHLHYERTIRLTETRTTVTVERFIGFSELFRLASDDERTAGQEERAGPPPSAEMAVTG
jgi:hypothetical protein